jgi:hypothetical protein
MPHKVMFEDWSEYDNRKIRDGRDRSRFSCEETWEVDYLATKLSRHYPLKSKKLILDAIKACCLSGSSRIRTEFVDCVTVRLR